MSPGDDASIDVLRVVHTGADTFDLRFEDLGFELACTATSGAYSCDPLELQDPGQPTIDYRFELEGEVQSPTQMTFDVLRTTFLSCSGNACVIYGALPCALGIEARLSWLGP